MDRSTKGNNFSYSILKSNYFYISKLKLIYKIFIKINNENITVCICIFLFLFLLCICCLQHPFFSGVDWKVVSQKTLSPPITPDLSHANCTADADLADQLLDNPPRKIDATLNQNFKGWNYNTEIHKPEENQTPTSTQPATETPAQPQSAPVENDTKQVNEQPVDLDDITAEIQ